MSQDEWPQVMLWSLHLGKFRTSTGLQSVRSRCWCNALINWAMKPLMMTPQITSSHNQWLHSSVGRWRALQRHLEVTARNPVEVLNFSGFSKQLLKLRANTARIIASHDFISAFQYMIHFINIISSLTGLFGAFSGALLLLTSCQFINIFHCWWNGSRCH